MSSHVCPACGSFNSEFNAFCHSCGTPLSSSVGDTAIVNPRTPGPALTPGTPVARYEILELIGRGAMGDVYRVADRDVGLHFALKLLSAELADNQTAQARLRREARAVGALQHRSIAGIHEMGEHMGRPFIVMALHEGDTLREVLTMGPLAISEAVRVGAELASALDAAHQAGITHRDVKPANIILARSGGVKLVDFGLAKLTDVAAPRLTRTGAVLGTIAYMSPEQLGGESVDHRADLWSLGVVLYESLAGTPPFMGSGLARRILMEEPDPVSSRRMDVPSELAKLVEQLLRKDPSSRVESAREVERRLRALPH